MNYNIRFAKMKLSHYMNLILSLVSFTQLASGQVDFALEGTSCQGYNVTLGCIISSFTSNAEWKRGNGSILTVNCLSNGFCSQVSQTIDGTKYSFSGNTSGIYMSTTLPENEHGLNWTCTYSNIPYIYQFDLGCSTPGSNDKDLRPLATLSGLGLFLLALLRKKKNEHCQYIYVKKGNCIQYDGSDTRDKQWKKDGKKCQPICNMHGVKMLIMNATAADEGLYVCSFGLNKMTMRYRIVVVEHVLYVQEHQDIHLGKNMQGKLMWTKGEAERVENGFITNASKKDEGLYVCTHEWRVPPLKFYLIVYGTEERVYVEKGCDIEFGKSVVTDVAWTGPANKEMTYLGNNMLVCEASLGDKGNYKCEFEKKEQFHITYSLTVVEIVYYVKEDDCITLGKNEDNNQKWEKNKTVLKGGETGLLIQNASAKDEGLYVCTTDKQTETYLIVIGTEETLYVQTGSDIEFGKSIVTNVTWTKNGKTIAWRPSLGNILIRDISVEDEGLYVCSFKSSKLESKYNLIVVGTEETLFLKIGSNIKFGKSLKTDVVWTKDGKLVEEKACLGNTISITRAKAEDGGKYVCTIKSNSMQLKYNVVIVGAIVEVNIRTGEDVTLGKPLKVDNNTVMWTRNGKRLETNEGTIYTICIASIDHNGTYVCQLGTKNIELIYVLTVESTENRIDDHLSIEMTSAPVRAKSSSSVSPEPVTV